MSAYVPARLRRRVLLRADDRCEYCLLPDILQEYPAEIDHVVPLKLGGETILDNLALACRRCNGRKGTNIAAVDPDGAARTFLFDPRADDWGGHFAFAEGLLLPRTATGRTTVRLLDFNDDEQVALRDTAASVGWSFP